MAMNPNHRFAILDASKGSRLIETHPTLGRALNRADYLTRARKAPIEVKDREQKNTHGKSVCIYRTVGMSDAGIREIA